MGTTPETAEVKIGYVRMSDGTLYRITGVTDAATEAYVDSKVPLVLGAEDPIPGGTPAGTIILRTET